MAKSSMVLFVACAFIFHICQAQKTDPRRLNLNLEIVFSKTENGTNINTDIRRELEAQRAINEDVSQTLEKLSAWQDKFELENQALNHKLESANQALDQKVLLESAIKALNRAMIEIQNDNENMRTELNKLQAACVCTSTTTSPTSSSTTAEPPVTTSIPTPTPPPFRPPCDEGWRYFNGHCYLFRNDYNSWDGASAYCEIM